MAEDSGLVTRSEAPKLQRGKDFATRPPLTNDTPVEVYSKGTVNPNSPFSEKEVEAMEKASEVPEEAQSSQVTPSPTEQAAPVEAKPKGIFSIFARKK